MQTTQLQNLRVQKWVASISVILLLVKFVAYYITHSVSVLTDALESIVNVSAGFIGLYSLYISSKPPDKDHPYGHGKAEFISAAVEGTLIITAGALIIYKAVKALLYPEALHQIDTGIWLVAITALVNYAVGFYCVRIGEKNQSMALVASGRHLQTDTFSTVGIICGLVILYFTKWAWVDSSVALIFGVIIIYTGVKILNSSIAGIMDKADHVLLEQMAKLLEKNRVENWIDLHNVRVIKYGAVLHLDCHLTIPWYLNVHEAHREIDHLAGLVRAEFGESLELFVHNDGCLPFSCRLCSKTNCAERQQAFERKVEWTLDSILSDQKHQL